MSKEKKRKKCQEQKKQYKSYANCSGNRRVAVRKATKRVFNALYPYRDDCDRVKRRIKAELIETIDLALSLEEEKQD